MPDFDETLFFPAFKAAGITTEASVVPKAGGAAVLVDAIYSRPDTRIIGSLSAQHSIEYQRADLPELAEGDAVSLAGVGEFVVREAPYVDGYEPTGFWAKALLSAVPA